MEGMERATCTAFEGFEQIASGDLASVVLKAKEAIDRPGAAPVLIFDDATSETVEVDFRGTADDVLKRLALAPARTDPGAAARPRAAEAGSGRSRGHPLAPALGLVEQPARRRSVALRKLVDGGAANEGRDRVRRSQEAAYRFMSALAGNLPGFEETARALFAGDGLRFEERIAAWPVDVKDHAQALGGRVRGRSTIVKRRG